MVFIANHAGENKAPSVVKRKAKRLLVDNAAFWRQSERHLLWRIGYEAVQITAADAYAVDKLEAAAEQRRAVA